MCVCACVRACAVSMETVLVVVSADGGGMLQAQHFRPTGAGYSRNHSSKRIFGLSGGCASIAPSYGLSRCACVSFHNEHTTHVYGSFVISLGLFYIVYFQFVSVF